jgi:hypothetical protein
MDRFTRYDCRFDVPVSTHLLAELKGLLPSDPWFSNIVLNITGNNVTHLVEIIDEIIQLKPTIRVLLTIQRNRTILIPGTDSELYAHIILEAARLKKLGSVLAPERFDIVCPIKFPIKFPVNATQSNSLKYAARVFGSVQNFEVIELFINKLTDWDGLNDFTRIMRSSKIRAHVLRIYSVGGQQWSPVVLSRFAAGLCDLRVVEVMNQANFSESLIIPHNYPDVEDQESDRSPESLESLDVKLIWVPESGVSLIIKEFANLFSVNLIIEDRLSDKDVNEVVSTYTPIVSTFTINWKFTAVRVTGTDLVMHHFHTIMLKLGRQTSPEDVRTIMQTPTLRSVQVEFPGRTDSLCSLDVYVEACLEPRDHIEIIEIIGTCPSLNASRIFSLIENHPALIDFKMRYQCVCKVTGFEARSQCMCNIDSAKEDSLISLFRNNPRLRGFQFLMTLNHVSVPRFLSALSASNVTSLRYKTDNVELMNGIILALCENRRKNVIKDQLVCYSVTKRLLKDHPLFENGLVKDVVRLCATHLPTPTPKLY